MNTNKVYVELTEDVERIEVHFKFDADDVQAVKTVRGRRFDPEGKFWTVPRDMKTARHLRELFGERMQLGPALKVWARDQKKHERQMRRLQTATDAVLERTPDVIMNVIAGLPIDHPSIPPGHALRKNRKPRPYQRADIKMMSMANAINANDVGTGKTMEAIGAIYEASIEHLPVLVVAPKRALVNVWKTEFSRLSDYEVYTSESPSDRRGMMEIVPGSMVPDQFVLGLIADDLRLEKYYDIRSAPPPARDKLHACRDYRGNWYRFKSELQSRIYAIEWGAFIIDEFHTTGLPNRNSLFSISAGLIKAKRKWPMSGTPIGGKPRRLWPILNFIDSRQYGSEWAWIDSWLDVTEEKVYVKGGHGAMRTVRTVGGIIKGKEQEFHDHHRMHMTRRTKKDALPGIPDAVEILVETPMAGKQRAEYQTFNDEHEIVLDGKRMSGSIVLSQYTRLRQMANAQLEWDRFYTKPVASKNSCKFEDLIERLDENGIRKSDFEPGSRAYIGVLDKGYLTQVIELLKREGIDWARLDGETTDSKWMLDRFADDSERPFVIAMTVQTGGTALNLERAGSAHLLDEPWDPDQIHQFFGRGDRGERDTPLKCYTYRTPHSIQEYVAKVAAGKKINNRTVLNYVKEIEELRRS